MGKKKANRKDGVEFSMMFRHHKDPLYYDTKANTKIFVPIVPTSEMTDEQRKIVESFPAEDMGQVLTDEQYAEKGYGQGAETTQGQFVQGDGGDLSKLIIEDQVEAAAKRMQLRHQAMIEKKERRQREKTGQIQYKSDDEEHNPYDSEEEDYRKANTPDHEDTESEHSFNSYDSELAADFFGAKDQEANESSFPKKEPKKSKKQKYNQEDFQEKIEDVNQELEKLKDYKVIEGVQFQKYDKYGLLITDDPENDARQYLAKEGDDDGFEFTAANDDQLEKAMNMQKELRFKGGRFDVDKKVDKMNEEEKAVFSCLQDDKNVFEGAYEELPDDFMSMLNEGMPAMELIKERPIDPHAAEQHENAGVKLVEDDPDDPVEDQNMIPNYKEKMADVIAALDKQKELRKFNQEKKDREVEKQAKEVVNQKDLDDVFKVFMTKEYKDEQIGDLDGDEGVDPLAFIEGEEDEERQAVEEGDDGMYDYGDLSDGDEMEHPPQPSDMVSMGGKSKMTMSNMDILEMKRDQDNVVINEAVDQFIQDKRFWFRDLHKQNHGDIEQVAKEKGENFKENTALYIGKGIFKDQVEDEEKDKKEKAMIKERTLAIDKQLQEEADERGTDYESPDEEDEAEKWDAETILSTYTNTDNHPGIIKFIPKVKVKNAIKLHTQLKVPMDGLDGLIPIAEEIEVRKKKKKRDYKNALIEDSEEDVEVPEDQVASDDGKDGEESEDDMKELNPRKAAKKLVKAEKRERRKQKKELKVAFKTTQGRIAKQQQGQKGISVRKID